MSMKRKARLSVETLEAREVPAIVLDPTGTLTIAGSAYSDTVTVNESGDQIVAKLTYRRSGRTITEQQSFLATSVNSYLFLGNAGSDKFYNNTGVAGTADGGSGNDYLEAGSSGDILKGGLGADTLVGFTGDDQLLGGSSRDYLFGLPGDDSVDGGDYNDYNYGGEGSDSLLDTHGTNVNDGLTDGPLARITSGKRSQKITDYLTPSDPGGGGDLSAIERAIFDLVNAERTSRGLAPLTLNTMLISAAQHHATNMAYFSKMQHTIAEADLPGLVDRLRHYGYTYRSAGENIAWNYSGATSVMNAWMNSSGHRANILSTSFTEIGIGVRYNSRGEPYYCQVFGRPA